MPTLMSSPTTADTADTLKRAGQDATVQHLTDRDAHLAALEAIVTALPPGTLVSINRIRHHLDAAGIPPRSRGGLMYAMSARGHLEPVFTSYRGIEVAVTEPSTGASAHHSDVRVYERPTSHPEGR